MLKSLERSMKKQFILLIFFSHILFSCLTDTEKKSDLLQNIPNDAILLIETRDLELIYNDFYKSSFSLIDSIPVFKNWMNVSNDLINIHNTEAKIIASLHKSGAESYSFLI